MGVNTDVAAELLGGELAAARMVVMVMLQMPETWRVHAKPHYIDRTADFLKQNLIAVGWGLLPDLSGLSRDQIERTLRKTYPKEPRDGYGPSVGQLDYLVNKIKVDDHIITPATTSDEVYLGTIKSVYRYSQKHRDRDDKTGERGFPHHRLVHWLLCKQSIPIEDLPLKMRAALRAHQPIVKVGGNHNSFFKSASSEDGKERNVARAPSASRNRSLHRSQDADDAYESVEGERRLVMRLERRREAEFRHRKIAEARGRGDGRLRCEVAGCGFDFEAVYGTIGAGFIHVHHRRSLARYIGPRKLDGLMLICPNCHAMIHRNGMCRDPNELTVRRPCRDRAANSYEVIGPGHRLILGVVAGARRDREGERAVERNCSNSSARPH